MNKRSWQSLAQRVGAPACLFVCFVAIGCGGKGGSTPAPNPPPAPGPVVQTLPAGAWRGAMVPSNGQSVDCSCVILDSGFLVATTQNGYVLLSDLTKPDQPLLAYALGTENKFSDGSVSTTVTMRLGAFVPGVSFSATYQLAAGETGNLNFTTYQTASDRPLSLATAAGTYKGPATAGTVDSNWSLTLNASGVAIAHDDKGNSMVGVYSVPNSSKAIIKFRLDPTPMWTNSQVLASSISGIALLAPRSGSTDPELTFVAVGEGGAATGVLDKQ